jgi:thiol-disulfide isomerase/thioredoxin
VRVAPCLIVAASVSVGLLGCSSTNRRPGGNGDGPFLGAGPQANAKKAEPTDPLSNSSSTVPDMDSMLAGQVLDGVNGRPVSAKIRCVCLDDPKAREDDKDMAETDAKGHYIIQGLKPGKQYKLIARAKQDGRTLVGVKYTLAPNPCAYIKLQEDLSKTGDEAAPPPPSAPGGKPTEPEPKKSSAQPTPERPASAQVPVPGWQPQVGSVQVPNPNAGGSGLGIGGPVPLGPQETPAAGGKPPWDRPPPRVSAPPDPSRIADGKTTRQPPVSDWRLPPAPVPSCVLINKQLVNFALYDLKGQAWEYRKQRRGKLMLIDFWSTSCLPCLQTVPYVRQLQDRYGSLGLEVVGIAYEDRGTPPEQAKRVSSAAQGYKLNYTLLLGSGAECPVKTQFGVRAYPVLLLVDRNGWIVWRHEGRLEQHHYIELERRVGMWLGTN